jgi:predicted outer membrane protein/sporulation protein YlmC with PRC-barrel domain
MKRTLLVVLNSTAALALVLAASPASAQQNDGQTGFQTQQQQNRQYQNQQYQNQRDLSAADFVRRAAIGNLFEIRASQLATSRANNDVLQDFARTLVEDHRAASQDLREAAGNNSVEAELDRRHRNMIDRLQRASGNDFDRQFIRMQIRAHREAISLYRNWINQNGSGSGQTTASGQANQANQDLVEFAEATLPTLEEHLRTAQDLRSELRQGRGMAAGQNRRTTAQNQRSGNTAQNWQRNAQNRQAGRDTLEIQQRAPEVTVRRQSPEVSVRQPRPQITVRQAPPTVTIQQPPPEVIVQMPRPDVNVQSPRPQVSVDVQRPQIRFQESDSEPRVRFQQQASDGRQIEFERGQPEVDYQRTGQPRVVYQQSDSEPRVRYQSQAQSGTEGQRSRNQSDRDATDGQRSRNQSERNAQQSDNRDWATEARRLTEDDTATEAATTGSGGTAQSRSLTAEQLTDLDIYNARGENLGSIDDVIVSAAGRNYVVLAHGGFLGMFQDEVALPLDRLRYRGDRIVVSGLTEQEISDMPDWETRVPNHQSVDDAQTLQINQ